MKMIINNMNKEILSKIVTTTQDNSNFPHTMAFVSPAGHGKITTIAKIATKIILDSKNKNLDVPKILLISTDYKRVGAYEQLSKWANIMDVDVAIAKNKNELSAILDKSNADYILIDTFAFNQNDEKSLKELKNLLKLEKHDVKIFLAISSLTSSKDFKNIISKFDLFDWIILTHCDEAVDLDGSFEVLKSLGLEQKLAWLSIGDSAVNSLIPVGI